MHEQEVVAVVLQTEIIGDAGTHRHGTHSGVSNQWVQLFVLWQEEVHQLYEEDAAGRGDDGAEQTLFSQSQHAGEQAAPLLDDANSLQGLYVKVGDNGTLSHHIPLKRTRLFNCLKRLGAPDDVEVETRLVGRVEIDTNVCMSCRMCAVFCPTGALLQKGSPTKDDEPFGLLHRPSLCMQCRSCEQVCSKDAITVTPKLPLRQFLGKEELFIELPRPKWIANTPESMYDRFADMIGRDINTGHF